MKTEETLSLQLYNYLCEEVGSEKTVFTRRWWYKINDDITNTSVRNHFIAAYINSGSKAEGLDFKGSDLDIMIVLKPMVYNHTRSPSKSHLLCYNTENSQPGFCKIEICPTLVNNKTSSVFLKFWMFSHWLQNATVFTDNGILISSDGFKDMFKFTSMGISHLLKIDTTGIFKLHGPCVSLSDDSVDIAFCLRCPLWPPEASNWITRHRSSNWPLPDIIYNIIHEGILFVPIGPSTEWRISFSVAEKLLIHSFNHTQLLCYTLLKFVLKEVINDVADVKDLLCSYFMKTVVFWISEEIDVKNWTPLKLLPCFQQCLKRLVYFVKCGYCPNYFMPDNNMFKNKIYGKYQTDLVSFLTDLYDGGMLYVVMCCKSLYEFNNNNMTFTRNIEDIYRGVYPLLGNYSRFIAPSSLFPILMRAFYVKEIVPKHVMQLYVISIAKYIRRYIYHYAGSNHGERNQKHYITHRNRTPNLLIAATVDNVRGWLHIAMCFYCNRQFNQALQIVDFVLSECTDDNIYFQEGNDIYPRIVSKHFHHLPLVKRLKLTCVLNNFGMRIVNEGSDYFALRQELSFKLMCDRISSKSPLLGMLISLEKESLAFGDHLPIRCASTPVLAEYISLMCYHHLENYLESQRALYRLKGRVERLNENEADNVLSSCIFLERAVSVVGSDIDTKTVHDKKCWKFVQS